MKRRRLASSSEIEMQMTSMIDVTFLLLIFFLLGTKFKEPAGRLNAFLPKDRGPNPNNVSVIEPEEELVIRVMMKPGHTKPVYKLGDTEYPTVADLEQKLLVLYGINADQPVTIDPDPRAQYNYVLQVLNSCIKVGYAEIAFSAPIPKGPQVPGARWRDW
ncbi:MAG TPA: biopolymer transporter ExbD [Planctomycetota bacterium]|nr:biopolymer transporter ExbD [Planctomycetota bacterium]